VHTGCEVTGLAGGRHLERVTWTDRSTGQSQTHRMANLFLMLGAVPNTEWLAGAVDLDDRGFVRCGPRMDGAGQVPATGLLETSRPGVFAVGDVRAGSVKRVASAVGEGSVVVSQLHAFLADAGAAA
jgi:thioredoxin reductase (NADPH)